MNSNARCSGEARRQDCRDPSWESGTCVPFVHPLNFLYAGTSYATISNAAYQADFVRSTVKIVQIHLSPKIPEPSSNIHTSMSSLTCSNCGFVNSLPPEPHSDALEVTQCPDSLVSQILRGSRPLLGSDHASINDETAKLEQLGSWYNAQLHAVLKSLEHHKSVFAPIRRLPRDILLEIFHSVCDSWRQDEYHAAEDESTHDSLDMARPLWVLGRVCGLWRDILHTSPASWARYVLVKPPFSKHAPEILQTYLERTGEHPLSLVAICSRPKFAKDREIMSLLVQSSYRWRNACIRTHAHLMHHLESVSHFPVLQTIEMDIFDEDGYPSKMSSDICLKAPQLWQAIVPDHGIHKVRLPSRVTHYSGYIGCVEDLQLLSQLPKLRTCHLLPSIELSSTPAPVVMAELRQLYVEDSDTLDLLTAPILQSLTIVEVPEGSPSSSVSPPSSVDLDVVSRA